MAERKKNHRYATVIDEDGVNYREIAEIMTEFGYPMNHSSARNYVIRVMRHFVDAYAKEYDVPMTDDRAFTVAKDPNFQSSMAEILHTIELERRRKMA